MSPFPSDAGQFRAAAAAGEPDLHGGTLTTLPLAPRAARSISPALSRQLRQILTWSHCPPGPLPRLRCRCWTCAAVLHGHAVDLSCQLNRGLVQSSKAELRGHGQLARLSPGREMTSNAARHSVSKSSRVPHPRIAHRQPKPCAQACNDHGPESHHEWKTSPLKCHHRHANSDARPAPPDPLSCQCTRSSGREHALTATLSTPKGCAGHAVTSARSAKPSLVM